MSPLLLTGREVIPLSNLPIQKVWLDSYDDYCLSQQVQSPEQRKASRAILACKSGGLGVNVSRCSECGHMEFHNNSCRSRSCPNCQGVFKELWVDQRRAEVIDSPYFHVVFTLPHELNPLIYCNQRLLYGLLHQCCAQTLLELSADRHYLGAKPGIIQVLHTWNQELDYHVHMHCIISGGGLTPDRKIRKASSAFFIPAMSFGINSKENISPSWIPSTSRKSLFSLLPVIPCRIPGNGSVSKTACITKTGALISKRRLTGLAMPSNNLGVTRTGLPFRTTASFLFRKPK